MNNAAPVRPNRWLIAIVLLVAAVIPFFIHKPKPAASRTVTAG